MALITNSGTQYVACDKCNSTGLCPKCNGASGQSSYPKSNPGHKGTSNNSGYYNPPRNWDNDYIPESTESLKKDFKTEETGEGIRYIPKNVRFGNNSNEVFFYFVKPQNGSVGKLRLRIQLYADMYVKFKAVEFTINDNKYRINSSNVKRSKVKGKFVSEIFDESLSYSDRDFIYAITHCNYAEVRLLGETFNHVIPLSSKQLDDLSNSYKLYIKSGGNF
ncbi:MAG: hypothetical protein IKW83_10935 [Muribaculaceae bacterium]|nr:hypothetical protein [Muribaculaceae bacterium]